MSWAVGFVLASRSHSVNRVTGGRSETPVIIRPEAADIAAMLGVKAESDTNATTRDDSNGKNWPIDVGQIRGAP